MSTKKQREIIRKRRIEFDKRVEENRKKMEAYVKEQKEKPVKTETKKRGRPKKKVD